MENGTLNAGQEEMLISEQYFSYFYHTLG